MQLMNPLLRLDPQLPHPQQSQMQLPYWSNRKPTGLGICASQPVTVGLTLL